MRGIGRLLALIGVYALIMVVVLEIGLRLLAPNLPGQIGVAARYVTTGQPYAADWSPAWERNREFSYALRPGLTDSLQYGSPLVTFRLSTIELWEGGGVGFRTDPVDFFVDAVVVGDSFGLCFTERADCWVDLLAQQTERGIVNLSQPVTGTTSHYRILRDFGAPLEPPLVIWQFFGNDFNEDYGLAVYRDEIAPVEPAGGDSAAAGDTQTAWLRANSALYAVLETLFAGRYLGTPAEEALFIKPHTLRYGPDNEHVLQFGGLYEQQALDMSREANQIGYDLSRGAFQQAQTLIETWGGELVVVLMPTREEVYAHLTAPVLGDDTIARLASARAAMRDLCTDLDLTCYDPTEDFRELARAGEALYHIDDMHLNPRGNAALAGLLVDWLAPLWPTAGS